MRLLYFKHLLAVLAALVFSGFASDWINNYFIREYQDRAAEKVIAPVAKNLIERFDAIPAERWPEEASARQERLDMMVKLQPLGMGEFPPLDDVVLSMVEPDKRYYSLLAPNGVYAQVVLVDGQTVLDLGPFPGSFWIAQLDTLVQSIAILLLVALALWLSCYSIGRRIDAIKDGAERLIIPGEIVPIADKTDDPIGRAATAVDTAAHILGELIVARDRNIEDQRDLLHGVAHEFRNPLARIQFASDMAAGAESEDERAKLFRDLAIAVSDLDDLVKEVLNYSRLRDGHYELKRTDVKLADVLNDISQNVKLLYPGIAIEVGGSAYDCETAFVDERMFRRVIMNLIRNAARFALRQVKVVWNIYPLHFTVSVEDDGPGVPPGKRDRLFEPFTRLDESRSRDSGGVGLGLAVVKSITEKHYGSIEVTDSELGGASFDLEWPLVRSDGQAW